MVNHDKPGQEPMLVVFGTFKDNKITSPEGEVTECVTYGSVRERIENKQGFYHLIKYDGILDWVIYQYVLLDQ